MFDPPKVRKVKILKLLWGFFRRQFAYFCLFWHLNRPRPAAQWVRPNFFGPEGGQTIPPHHSIAKYLKNLKLIPRTTTFFLRHCVKKLTTYSIKNASKTFWRTGSSLSSSSLGFPAASRLLLVKRKLFRAWPPFPSPFIGGSCPPRQQLSRPIRIGLHRGHREGR